MFIGETASSHMLFLLPSEVYTREEHGNVTELSGGGCLTWVRVKMHKNGHLSITLSYMLIIIYQSHHSA